MDISLSSSEKKMASISMMIGGAFLNAAAFTSGNYCFLNTGKASLEEKTLHDKAVEAYQAVMAKYTSDRTKLVDWIKTNKETKNKRSKTLRTPIACSNTTIRHTRTGK